MAFLTSYNCIIIDDQEIDRLTVYAHARKYPYLNILGVFASAAEAKEMISQSPVHMLLLDIDMPEVSGLEFRKEMMEIPVCIFISSYPDYASETFELSALDFLNKPFHSERFAQSMKRAKEYLDLKQKAEFFDFSIGGNSIFVKDGHSRIKLGLKEILYLEALKDYTLLVTAEKNYCVLSSIGNLLKEQDFSSFIRIHRSYAVQKHFISAISPYEVSINEIPLPIGRSYKVNVDSLTL